MTLFYYDNNLSLVLTVQYELSNLEMCINHGIICFCQYFFHCRYTKVNFRQYGRTFSGRETKKEDKNTVPIQYTRKCCISYEVINTFDSGQIILCIAVIINSSSPTDTPFYSTTHSSKLTLWSASSNVVHVTAQLKLKEAQLVLIIGDEHVLGLAIVVEHHLVCLNGVRLEH